GPASRQQRRRPPGRRPGGGCGGRLLTAGGAVEVRSSRPSTSWACSSSAWASARRPAGSAPGGRIRGRASGGRLPPTWAGSSGPVLIQLAYPGGECLAMSARERTRSGKQGKLGRRLGAAGDGKYAKPSVTFGVHSRASRICPKSAQYIPKGNGRAPHGGR